ncbi:GPI-anchored protein LLG1-like [Andrographis paniculata]|uniref:GPI-anchored protein LLG1-like n=1 Tax=Andrographis paniculata TaxID=175694 RepID=UPI0021E8040D|nr:GPI-anchored protein LLG1-like [Andrographis paniculata]
MNESGEGEGDGDDAMMVLLRSESSATGVSQRKLFQLKKSCPINFETQNYTILTSQCKAPDYPVEPCCSALRQFACPFRNELNDQTNDCYKTMFDYINGPHKYPNTLFTGNCNDNRFGLSCPASAPSPGVGTTHKEADAAPKHCVQQLLVVLSFSIAAVFML